MLQLILYAVISPVLWPVAKIILLLLPKMRTRFFSEARLRKVALAKLKENRGEKKVLIFHAASAGEFEQLKPLLLKVNRTGFFVFQTFSSPTIFEKERESDLFDAACYHPEDSILWAFYFFAKIKPSAYIVNRHDLWPAHILCASMMKIKTVFINANFYEKSLRFRLPLRSANRAVFELFDLILCGSKRIRDNILNLAPGAKVSITGDSRFDQVALRKGKNRKNHFGSKTDILNRRNIVLGSIIPSDYDVILTGLREFLDKKNTSEPKYRIIAVPHEVAPKDISGFIKCVEKHGFTHTRHSESGKIDDCDIVIIDSVGILAELYCYAYTAYVGAGFGAGVHSAIEPAVYGVPVFFGPNYHILDEAVRMVQEGIARVVHTDNEVTEFLGEIDNTETHGSVSKDTLDFVAQNTSSSVSILNHIETLVSSGVQTLLSRSALN
ncbi:3-deoxy-D-manno-octulosonic-acid transferase [Chitinispirillum alkaliphilum]|nr:3-deoxy-D-manno-octulosonic-acid transferase [Chitinispirillum alkaliphilum]